MCHSVLIKSVVLTFTVSSGEVIFASTAVAICFILTNPAVLAWCRYTWILNCSNQINNLHYVCLLTSPVCLPAWM